MKIALLGAGLMGQALSEHLLAQNCSLTIFNRSPEKVKQLQQQGATLASSAQDALLASDYCLLMLSDAAAINDVLDTIQDDSFNNKLIIQMGTIAPDESRLIANRITQHHGHYLECPD